MAVKAVSYKNWCTDHISPQSWPRILLRSLDIIRSNGYKLKDFDEPETDLDIPADLLAKLNESLTELYETSVEENLLNMY
jgi:hypothetical protein